LLQLCDLKPPTSYGGVAHSLEVAHLFRCYLLKLAHKIQPSPLLAVTPVLIWQRQRHHGAQVIFSVF